MWGCNTQCKPAVLLRAELMTWSEQGQLGTNPGRTPEDAMGCLSSWAGGPSPQHTVIMKGMGLAVGSLSLHKCQGSVLGEGCALNVSR